MTFFRCIVLIVLGWPAVTWATVVSDFEKGSGGMKAVNVENGMTHTIFALMLIFGAWVMVHTLRKLITADQTTYYETIGLMFRATIILLVMILALT